MNEFTPRPWNPARLWADPLITALALMILILAGGQAKLRRQHPPRVEQQVGLEGRLQDLILSSPRVLAPMVGRPLPQPAPLGKVAAAFRNPWDKALLAVQAGEDGDLATGAELAKAPGGSAGDAFRKVWAWAYAGLGSEPSPVERLQARTALGQGYSARILDARVEARAGRASQGPEQAARQWLLPRLGGLMVAGFGGLVLLLGGAGFAIYLGVKPRQRMPLPAYGMSGRALLIVLLGWFLCLMASGTVVGILVALAPFLRPIALPLSYLLHACLGLRFLCAAEGIDLATLWRRLTPGPAGRALATGLGFFALAFTAVLAVSVALGPLLRHAEPPQRELLDLLGSLRGPLAVALVFLTVAVVAPAFEEVLFRGFLLPWLGERLEARLGPGWGRFLAIAATGLTFAAIHLQPLGLPTLGTLGLVLGFAFARTGNLLTAILVHGLWNGGVFILMRVLTT